MMQWNFMMDVLYLSITLHLSCCPNISISFRSNSSIRKSTSFKGCLSLSFLRWGRYSGRRSSYNSRTKTSLFTRSTKRESFKSYLKMIKKQKLVFVLFFELFNQHLQLHHIYIYPNHIYIIYKSLHISSIFCSDISLYWCSWCSVVVDQSQLYYTEIPVSTFIPYIHLYW